MNELVARPDLYPRSETVPMAGSGKRRGRVKRTDQLVLAMEQSLVADALGAVLEKRLSDAGLVVSVVRSPGDLSETRRSSTLHRVVLTDRLDLISRLLIARTLAPDVFVFLGEPEAEPRRLGKETPYRIVALPADADANSVFAELFPLFPLPPAATKTAKAVGKRLAPRETEVLRHLAEGRTVQEIADHLNLAKRTVENQKYSVMRKLQMKTLPELTRYAIRIGLIEP